MEIKPIILFSVSTSLEYSGVPLKRGQILHDILNITALTGAEYKSEFKAIKDTPYFALMGEL